MLLLLQICSYFVMREISWILSLFRHSDRFDFVFSLRCIDWVRKPLYEPNVLYVFLYYKLYLDPGRSLYSEMPLNPHPPPPPPVVNTTDRSKAVVIIIIMIITSLFREDDILSSTNYLSDIWSSIIKLMYLNYRQFVQYIHIQYENVTFK